MLKSICSRLNYREPLAEVSWKLEDNTDPDRRLKKIENGIKMIKKVVKNFEKKVLEGNEILSKKKPARKRKSDTVPLIGIQQEYQQYSAPKR